ncbi:Fn3-like domain-containing protein [Mycena sanguinolenta]|uniref:beta-glucosidase n=1 Tax=Mycena sanguinolenta TaxID=230812 RepID=A0A8H7DF39_9AGAR|nr:Fn3-like domain-containing protein [Mycena sanguinolenta]
MLRLLLLALLVIQSLADVTTGIPDQAPPGFEIWESPIVLPAPPVQGLGNWAVAVAKAKKFVAGLTLPEKINITTGVDIQGRCVGEHGGELAAIDFIFAGRLVEGDSNMPTIPRIGWEGLCLNDSPVGVRFSDFASEFPSGINAAATWDVDLIKARGVAMGQEHRGKGVNVALGPMTNMGRVAAGGRNWEGFGGDPFLSGVAVAATIEGMQSVGVIATVKHFIGNEQEHFRGGSESFPIYSSNIDDRTLHEVYLWPFAEAVKAGVGAVMCSYNLINQTQACQNSKLLNGVLKEELGFQGFITSDWAAMLNGVQPALAGLDMNMPGFVGYSIGDQNQPDPSTATNSWWGAQIITMINNGSVPESRIDDMVTRTIAAWYQMRQDEDYPRVSFSQLTEDTFRDGELVNEHINVQGDHYKIIREIGAASAILLKNTNNALPLAVKNLKRISRFLHCDYGVSDLYQVLAYSVQTLVLTPMVPTSAATATKGCDEGTLALGWGSGTANFPYLIDPLAAITQHIQFFDPTVVIEGVLGDYNFANQTAIASLADTCLVFVNADSGEGYITVDENAGDRNNLTLWKGGEALIDNVAASCANTIVVQHVVGPVLVESWIDNPNVTAVLHAGIPGQESGNAIVDVLFSDGSQSTNPSGRLPYTIAKQRSDYGADVLYTAGSTVPQITYSEGLNIDYRWFDANNITPRFEFGFGLSYTTFGYSGLKTSVSKRRRADERQSTTTAEAHSTSAPASSEPASVIAASTSKSSQSVSTMASISSVLPSAPASGSTSASASASVNPTSTATAPGVISSPVGNISGPAALYETAATVSFKVQNTGHVGGNEVAQLYLGFPASYNEPPKVLRGFVRKFLNPGQSETISIPLRQKDLSVWDVVKQEWMMVTGAITVSVGSSSRNIHLTGTLNL